MNWVEVESGGGVALRLPDDWALVATTAHGAVFGGEDAGAPSLVLREVAGHLTPDAWWDGVADDPTAVLVDLFEDHEEDDRHEEDGDGLDGGGQDDPRDVDASGRGGFRTRHAWLRDDRSMTTRTRVLHLPGRSLVAAVVAPTATASDHAATSDEVLGGLHVAGARPVAASP